MFKTLLSSFTLSAALAAPASAQWIERGSIQDAALRTGMYQSQIEIARSAYFYETGYDGFAPAWQNPNAWYVPSGGGVLPYGYLQGLGGGDEPLVIVQPGGRGGCFPGGGFNNTGWGVGVNAGVGGNFGGGRNYNYNNTSWGIGVNGGVGGNSGSWGGGGFNNLGWGVGVNGGIGGNSGSFRSW